jgi:hypothetical protein
MSGLLGVAFGPIAGIAQTAMPMLTATGLLPSWIRAPRSIGKVGTDKSVIIPDVTIEENHSDRLTVTQHPIATGTPISDHAYLNPATITMRIGFTNANPMGAAISGGIAGFASGGITGALAGAAGINTSATGVSDLFTGGGLMGSVMEQRCKQVYEKLRTLQFDKAAWNNGRGGVEPFTLVTGKREYKNVVITEISVRTDRTSEYSLMVEVHMQEVFIVIPKSTTQPSQANQATATKPSTASTEEHPPAHPTEEEHPPSPNSRQKDNPWLPNYFPGTTPNAPGTTPPIHPPHRLV